MLSNFIGDKVRLIIYNKQNEPIIDLICKHLDNELADLFSQYRFIGHHKTQVTGLNVIELVKE